jgi:hypothetical protein
MKTLNFRFVLAAICLASFLPGATQVNAAPVQFGEVVQFVSAKPGKAATGSFSRLGLVADNTTDVTSDDDDDKKKQTQPQTQDGRVITTTTTEVVTDEDCNCVQEVTERRGFPKWALLGLAAIPIAIILIRRKKDRETPTPTTTPSIPITQTPTVTPTPGTPTPTVTPPPTTPTPPEPVPEPMTILLFGTGLAGIGMAARKRFGKKAKTEENEG